MGAMRADLNFQKGYRALCLKSIHGKENIE